MLSVNFFEALLDHTFMLYALIAGVIVGILAPMIGSIVVIRRLSFIADTISHFSLAGVCLGVIVARVIPFENVSPILMGIIFGIIGTFLIERLRSFYRNYKEISMPIVMSLGLALSGLLINLSPEINRQYTTSLLYGSIYGVSRNELLMIIILSVLIGLFLIIYHKQIITLSFDENYARISGLRIKFLQLMITIFLSVIISLFLNFIGVLLISSLMIIPVAAAILIGKSFKNSISLSIIFSEVSVIGGFVISYYFDLSTGPIIILINLFIYIIILCIASTRNSNIKKKNFLKTGIGKDKRETD